MTNSKRLAAVRTCLLVWLADQQSGELNAGECSAKNAATTDNPGLEIVRESILIRNEFYCGRRFHTASHDAVWFIEEDELKIYGNDGQLAAVLSGGQIDQQAESDVPHSADERAPSDDSESDLPDVIKMPETIQRDPAAGDDIRRVA